MKRIKTLDYKIKEIIKKLLIEIFDEEENVVYDLSKLLDGKKQTGETGNYSTTSLRCGSIEINQKYRMGKRDGANVKLTNYEFDILYLLARHPGQVFSKKQIYEQVWNMPCLGAENNVVSLIYRIRKKIESNPAKPVYILTVWGIGYKFSNASDV